MLAGRAYLAVDFFFVLSGFVLAHAYESKLMSGELTAISFLRLRLARLWPLAALGMLLGFITTAYAPGTLTNESWRTPALVVALVFGLLLLPSPESGLGAYPLNPPIWSVAYELAVNYAYALFSRRLSEGWLRLIVVLAAVALAATTIRNGTANTFDPARVVYSFFFGVLLSRRMVAKPRVSATKPVVIAALLISVLFFPGLRVLPGGAPDAFCCIVVFPSIVWAGAHVEPVDGLTSWCAASGELSYPLYAIHYPIVVVSMSVAASRVSGGLLAGTVIPVVSAIGLLSLAVARRCDQPVRAAMARARRLGSRAAV